MTTEWDVSGKIEADAEFRVQFLAALQAKFGAQVTHTHITEKSDEIEAQMNVPPGHEAYINTRVVRILAVLRCGINIM